MNRSVAVPVVAALLTLETVGWADYLEIRRPANLKKTAESGGEVLASLTAGAEVELRSEDQDDGYYKVRTRNGQTGFVYRTLVRRHPGALPPAAPAPAGHPPENLALRFRPRGARRLCPPEGHP